MPVVVDPDSRTPWTMPYTTSSSLLTTFLPFCLFPLLMLLSLLFVPLAVLTTCMAISALTLRAAIVYFELAFALLRQKLGLVEDDDNPWDGTNTKSQTHPTVSVETRSLPNPGRPSYHDTALRRSPTYQRPANSTLQPIHSSRNDNLRPQVDDKTSLMSDADILPSRDYEGIGGWTTVEPDPSVEKQGQKSCKNSYLQWLTMNSRLELPNPDPIASTIPKARGRWHSSGKRKHERSATAGSLGLSASNRSNTEGQSRLDDFNRSGRHKSMILLGRLDSGIGPLTATKAAEAVDSSNSSEGSSRSSMDESGDVLTMG